MGNKVRTPLRRAACLSLAFVALAACSSSGSSKADDQTKPDSLAIFVCKGYRELVTEISALAGQKPTDFDDRFTKIVVPAEKTNIVAVRDAGAKLAADHKAGIPFSSDKLVMDQACKTIGI